MPDGYVGGDFFDALDDLAPEFAAVAGYLMLDDHWATAYMLEARTALVWRGPRRLQRIPQLDRIQLHRR